MSLSINHNIQQDFQNSLSLLDSYNGLNKYSHKFLGFLMVGFMKILYIPIIIILIVSSPLLYILVIVLYYKVHKAYKQSIQYIKQIPTYELIELKNAIDEKTNKFYSTGSKNSFFFLFVGLIFFPLNGFFKKLNNESENFKTEISNQIEKDVEAFNKALDTPGF